MKKIPTKKDLLIGEWRSPDAFVSEVVYRVSKTNAVYSVVACDASDGELADIFEVKWDAKAGILSFAAHWNSTGRFSRCQLRAITKTQVNLTYTYTDTAALIRADTKKS